jgi:hypothetical protein
MRHGIVVSLHLRKLEEKERAQESDDPEAKPASQRVASPTGQVKRVAREISWDAAM